MKRWLTVLLALLVVTMISGIALAAPVVIKVPYGVPNMEDPNGWNTRMLVGLQNEFNSTHKDIQIQLVVNDGVEKLTLKFGTEDAPDILTRLDFIGTGAFLDLGPYVKRDGFDFNISRGPAIGWFQPFLDKVPTLQVIPAGGGEVVQYINENLFEAAGIPFPEMGWTFSDLIAYSQKMTYDSDGDGVIDRWGFGHQASWSMDMMWPTVFARSMPNDVIDWNNNFEFKLNQGAALEDMQFRADTVLKYGALLEGQGAWGKGQIAMYQDYDSRIQRMFAGVDEGLAANVNRFRMVYLPRHDKGETYNYGWGGGIGIYSGTKHPDEAWEVLKWLATKGEEWKARFWSYPGNQQAIVNVARSGDLEKNLGIPASWDLFELMKPIFEPPARSVSGPNVPGWSNVVWDYVDPVWEDVVNNGANLKAGLDGMKAAVEALVREKAAQWMSY